MKNLLITLPMFLILGACGKDDEDTGADDSFSVDGGTSDDGGGGDGSDDGGTDGGGGGGDVMNSSPGCGAEGIVCYSFVGPLWASQDTNGACSQLSGQSQSAGAGALTYIAEGCPAGASSECSGILGLVDQDNNVLDGSDYSIYFYGGADGSADCTANGGTYTTF